MKVIFDTAFLVEIDRRNKDVLYCFSENGEKGFLSKRNSGENQEMTNQ